MDFKSNDTKDKISTLADKLEELTNRLDEIEENNDNTTEIQSINAELEDHSTKIQTLAHNLLDLKQEETHLNYDTQLNTLAEEIQSNKIRFKLLAHNVSLLRCDACQNLIAVYQAGLRCPYCNRKYQDLEIQTNYLRSNTATFHTHSN